MGKDGAKYIYTVGHSTRSIDEFITLLASQAIDCVVDVRRFPGSRKYPQFNQTPLQESLEAEEIGYRPMKGLGGRRKMRKDSKNTRWRNASFQGYADYMETAAYRDAFDTLEAVAREERVAIMCAEAVWWRCHRSMISDELKARGWTVLHILGPEQPKEHPYTSPARVVGEQVFYDEPEDGEA